MDKKQTIQWVISAIIRLAAGYVAFKFGKDAVTEGTWTSLAEALGGVVVAGLSIYSSVRSRRTLLTTEPPR